ncbi:MAG: HAMP domain-containing histidine kinase [Actinobacteria bacterium]|nr:MAG: HAMP domain-containing histidine kinase [Actinomycetota bacterium]
MVNEAQLRALVEGAAGAVVVLDDDGNVVAASAAARDADPGEVLTLYAGEPPTAYQELRAGFTAAVSHELRTPLARLLALLESVELPEADVSELVEAARQEVQQIRELIDDVLFLGELETGRGVVSLGATEAMPILEDIAEQLAERAARAGMAIRVGGDPSIELPLRPRMIRVVAENLAENSLRYAGLGATFELELARRDGEVVLTAADNGAGVSDEDLPRLFERFYRADRARASRGTGLGLAIVKHVVTSAGGRVEANAREGGGLEIRVVFPGRYETRK